MSRHGKTRFPASSSARAPGSGLGHRAPASATGRRAAVSVTVVAWASAFVAIRGAGRYFDPVALVLGRLLAGSLVLGAVWLARGALCLAGVAISRGRTPPVQAEPGAAEPVTEESAVEITG